MNGIGYGKWIVYGQYALVVALTELAVRNGGLSATGDYSPLYTGAAVLCGLALLVRRIPWPVGPILTTVATALWGWPMLPLLLVALFRLAVDRRAAVAIGCTVFTLAGNVVLDPVIPLSQPQQYGSSLFLLLAIVGGLWMGNRRRLVEALNAQVEHLRVERELREQAARATERSAIAAEMHDVLAHRLSLIALHTGVLGTKAEALPVPVAERLALLRTAATDALTDLRDVLGALRAEETGAPSSVPVLRTVQELIDQAREAGQPITMATRGLAEDVSVTHRLAVYRVVQESLTNARKHASGAPVDICIDYRAPAIMIDIANGAHTRAVEATPSGFGLVGLRERVTMLGGEICAGLCDKGGWKVAARIPHSAGAAENGISR